MFWPAVIAAQQPAVRPATIKEFKKTYRTYGYGDPDPVPNAGRIYPYFRFDGFTDKPEKREWKVVELENDYIRVQVMPEIGGKIWTAVDKKNKRPFFYENSVVKFRDIAMRGPWTSGGLEANYGIIGHTPNCSTPVDYLVRTNEDGSASCIISTLDLLTRTRWSMEVNLPKDKAFFTTRSFWHNGTGQEQAYYTWMNAAVLAAEDLQFLYPGNQRIGHNGDAAAWPLDSARGKNLARFAENNYISSKSYHVLGTHSNYFGSWRELQDAGMIHYAAREDKLGKKIFSWALSDQGKIWEELLTDTDGQYVELQSGRLFNQNQPMSSFTPFRQAGFAPFASDSWTEYWYPFHQTGGITFANLNGAARISRQGNQLQLVICPVQAIADTLRVYNSNGKLLHSGEVTAQPLQPFNVTISLPPGEQPARLVLNNISEDLDIREGQANLQRPVSILPGYDPQSAYGLYLQGRDLFRFRLFAEAEQKVRASLETDSTLLPALVQMAQLHYASMRYDSAFHYARKALAIDTYHGAANYYYGLAAARLQRWYDALDGLEVASLSVAWRSAAYTALSRQYFRRGNIPQAAAYAARSLEQQGNNMDGLQLQYLAARLGGNSAVMEATRKRILQLDPLNHFIRFETYISSRRPEHREAFTGLIRNELPVETYLELGCWYAGLQRMQECDEVLALAPQNAEVLYWRAWLHPHDAQYLSRANASKALRVFPFREESAAVMQWAMQKSTDWKPAYFLALIHNAKNNKKEAATLLNQVQGRVNFAPFYIARAMLRPVADSTGTLQDLQAAAALEPAEWRYGHYLTRYYLQHKNFRMALKTITPYYRKAPGHYITGMLHTRCLLRNGQYMAAEKALQQIRILPFEGASDGRRLYEETKLMLAQQALQAKNYKLAAAKAAEARLWPRNLGVGKPYEEVTDSRLEDWMAALAAEGLGNRESYQQYLQQVKAAPHNKASLNTLVQCLALQRLGEQAAATTLLKEWGSLQVNARVAAEGEAFIRNHGVAPGTVGYTFLFRAISALEDARLF